MVDPRHPRAAGLRRTRGRAAEHAERARHHHPLAVERAHPASVLAARPAQAKAASARVISEEGFRFGPQPGRQHGGRLGAGTAGGLAGPGLHALDVVGLGLAVTIAWSGLDRTVGAGGRCRRRRRVRSRCGEAATRARPLNATRHQRGLRLR